MINYVLDTNFFVNLQRSLDLGKTKEEVLEKFVSLVEKSVKAGSVEFLTTPDTLKEISSFFDKDTFFVDRLMGVITIASPSYSELHLDATLFYDLVQEIGIRLYRGLRAAEQPVKDALQQQGEVSRGAEQTIIGSLRERYRRATREGFLDSTTDLGLILLAKERNATLVTSDNGLLAWARKFGCKEITPEMFSQKIKALG